MIAKIPKMKKWLAAVTALDLILPNIKSLADENKAKELTDTKILISQNPD